MSRRMIMGNVTKNNNIRLQKVNNRSFEIVLYDYSMSAFSPIWDAGDVISLSVYYGWDYSTATVIWPFDASSNSTESLQRVTSLGDQFANSNYYEIEYDGAFYTNGGWLLKVRTLSSFEFVDALVQNINGLSYNHVLQ